MIIQLGARVELFNRGRVSIVLELESQEDAERTFDEITEAAREGRLLITTKMHNFVVAPSGE